MENTLRRREFPLRGRKRKRPCPSPTARCVPTPPPLSSAAGKSPARPPVCPERRALLTIWLLIGAAILLVCIAASRFSGRFGVPMLLVFIALGMLFGSDGLFKIPFDDYPGCGANLLLRPHFHFVLRWFRHQLESRPGRWRPRRFACPPSGGAYRGADGPVLPFRPAFRAFGKLFDRLGHQLHRRGVCLFHPAVQKAQPQRRDRFPAGSGKRQQRPHLLYVDRHRPRPDAGGRAPLGRLAPLLPNRAGPACGRARRVSRGLCAQAGTLFNRWI